jgi:sortase A
MDADHDHDFESIQRNERAKQARRIAYRSRWVSITSPVSRLTQGHRARVAADGRSAERRLKRLATAMVLGGLSMLVFVVYAFVFTGLQEVRYQRSALELFGTASQRTSQQGALLLGHGIRTGQPVAVIEIPSIGVKQVVVKGTTATDLMRGPGLMADTAEPGTSGNAVIAGRHSTAGAPFAHILSLKPGAPITVVNGLGKFVYRVTGSGTVQAGDQDPIAPTPRAQLTLVTSNSAFMPSGRAYVTARLITSRATAPIPHAPPSLQDRRMGGDPAAILPTVEWAFVVAACLAASVAAFRRWSRYVWAVYLLSVPVVLAVLLIFYSNLFRLLPATL